MLLGCGVAGLLLLLGLSWLGFRSLNNSIGTEARYWARASEDWKKDDIWKPIVESDPDRGFKYKGEEPVGPGTSKRSLVFTDGDQPLEAFHGKLSDLAAKPLDVSPVFRWIPFRRDITGERPRAQRVVFENGVIKPLVEAAREKMATADTARSGWSALVLEAEALLELIRLEANIVRRRERQSVAFDGEHFLKPLTRYVSDTVPSGELLSTGERLYSRDGGGTDIWAPHWLTGNLSGPQLKDNKAIESGLNRFIIEMSDVVKKQEGGMSLIKAVLDEVRAYQKAEDALAVATRDSVSPAHSR